MKFSWRAILINILHILSNIFVRVSTGMSLTNIQIDLYIACFSDSTSAVTLLVALPMSMLDLPPPKAIVT